MLAITANPACVTPFARLEGGLPTHVKNYTQEVVKLPVNRHKKLLNNKLCAPGRYSEWVDFRNMEKRAFAEPAAANRAREST